jgi:hypothetical protein
MPRLPKISQKATLPAAPAAPDVPVLSPDGTPGTIPQLDVERALESGYRYDTPQARAEMERERDKQRIFGEGIGNEIAAAGFGAARTLSFGLSDWALAQTGLQEFAPEAMRELKERNPKASTAGEIGAFLVPLAGQALGAGSVAGQALGAGSVAGQALRLSGAGISGVGKVASSIGNAATKVTGNAFLGSAAQVAAESLAFNLAHNVSENVLGERELTAQRLLANSGQALALGAGLGFGIPLAAKGIKAAAHKAKESIAALGTSLRERVFPHVAQTAAKGYVGAYRTITGNEAAAQEVSAMLQGAGTPEGKAVRDEIVKAISPEADDVLFREFTQQLDDVHRATQQTVKRGFGEIRPQEVTKLLRDVDMRPALEDAGRLINKVDDVVKRMSDEPLLFDQGYRRELELVRDQLEQRVGSRAGGGKVGFKSTEELWSAIDDIKSIKLSDLSRFEKKTLTRAQENAAREIKSLYGAFREHLEDASLYGEAGARQAAFNEAFSMWKRSVGDKAENNFRRFFLTNGDIDATKVKAFLRKIGSGRDVDAVEALEEFRAAAQGIVEQVEKSAAGIGVADINREGFESILKKMTDTQTKAAADLAFTNKIRSHDMFGTAFMRFQETIGQALASRGVFAATINLANKAASPFGVVKALSTAEGLALDTSKRVVETVGRMTKRMGGAAAKGARAARPYVEPASVEILMRNVFGDDDMPKPRNRREGFRAVRRRLAEMQADPAGTAEKLAEGVQHLAPHAPELASSIVNTQMRAAAFLAEKAPQDPNVGKTLNPFLNAWEPSDLERATFERYAAAVADPLGALDELEAGSVSPEAVEALRAVYPALYEDLRTQLATSVSELQVQVPYRDRVQLSILFGVELDPSMNAAFVNAVQNSYSQPQEPAPRQSAYRPSTASSKLGALEETQAQRIASR